MHINEKLTCQDLMLRVQEMRHHVNRVSSQYCLCFAKKYFLVQKLYGETGCKLESFSRVPQLQIGKFRNSQV